MNEDKVLNDFLKRRLEDDVDGSVPHFDEIVRAAARASFVRSSGRRSRARFWGASMLAASLAVVCAFAVVALQSGSCASEATVADAIELLRMADGAESTDDAASVADMLLDWQDAPYETAVSDLLASYSAAAETMSNAY